MVRDAVAVLVVALLFVLVPRLLATQTAGELAFAVIDTGRNAPLTTSVSATLFEIDGRLAYNPSGEQVQSGKVVPVGNVTGQYVHSTLGPFDSPVIEEHTLRVLNAQSSTPKFSNDDVLLFVQREGLPMPKTLAERFGAVADHRVAATPAFFDPNLRLVRPGATGAIRHPERLWPYIRARWAGRFMLLGLVAVALAAWLCFPRSLIAFYRIQNCRCPRCSYSGDRRLTCPECGLRPNAPVTLSSA